MCVFDGRQYCGSRRASKIDLLHPSSCTMKKDQKSVHQRHVKTSVTSLERVSEHRRFVREL